MAYHSSPRIERIGSAFIVKMPRGYVAAESEVRQTLPDAVWSSSYNGYMVKATKGNRRRIESAWKNAKFFGQPKLDIPEDAKVGKVYDERLFPFQNQGVNFLVNRESAIMGDEMGLGKTVQVLVAASVLANQSDGVMRILIVVPKTLIENWQDEIDDWYDWEVPVRVITGNPSQRAAIIKELNGSEFCIGIINWEGLRAHTKNGKGTDNLLTKARYDIVIADEAHKAKNRKAQQTEALKRIPASRKWAMTGTPIMNRPDEIWSLLNWLFPSDFRSYWRFFERYIDYTEGYFGKQIFGSKNVKELGKILTGIMIRRLKVDVRTDMPPCLPAKIIMVDLSPAQRRAYNDIENHGATQLSDGTIVAATISISARVRMKQISVSLSMLTDGVVTDSSKIDVVTELIDDMGGKKLVVFSQFQKAVEAMHQKFMSKKIPHVMLYGGDNSWIVEADGDKKKVTRGQLIRIFQNDPKYVVYIGTTQAGGVGTTLTAASTVVLLDEMDNPADNAQAVARLDRIGQTESVLPIVIRAKNTIEESKIAPMLHKKTTETNSVLAQAEKQGRKNLRR